MNLGDGFSKILTIAAGASESGIFYGYQSTGLSYSLDVGSGWTTARLVIQGYNATWDRWETLAYIVGGTVTILEVPIDTNGYNIQLPAEMWQVGRYNVLRFRSIGAADNNPVTQTNEINISIRLQRG